MSGRVKPFYLGTNEETIDSKEVTFLLQATPFSRKTEINFSNRITEQFFFDRFYSEMWQPEDKAIKKKNRKFDKKVRNSLLSINNMDSKVDFIHIWGYAGCGKTTYVHRLLWELGIESNVEYTVIDFDLTNTAVQALKDTIYLKFTSDLCGIYTFFNQLIDGRYFILDAFGDVSKAYLRAFTYELSYRIDDRQQRLLINPSELSKIIDDVRDKITDNKFVKNIVKTEELDSANPYTDLLEFLLLVIFLFDIYEMLTKTHTGKYSNVNILLLDNVDSLPSQIEEYAVLRAVLEFRNNCNMFFSQNLKNENVFESVIAKIFLNRIKFSFFMTSRMVTVKQLLSVNPNFEDYIGKPNNEMPEYFYNHEDIFDRKINYYDEVEADNFDSEIMMKLHGLCRIKKMMYRAASFRKLFNGNVRFCFSTIENIYDAYHDMPFVNDCERLNKESNYISVAGHGANGIVLAMLADYMKEHGIFKEKLHLSICKDDDKVSLSRIVLTIIHEHGGSCSLLDIFRALPPRYCDEELCNIIYDLNETDRGYWRRLITFEKIIPRGKADLKEQLTNFRNNERDSQQYTKLTLCRSGFAYLSSVVPHFEFMLCRCNYPNGTLENPNFTPLFSEQSLNTVYIDGKKDYAFTIKIRRVLKTVKECSQNSQYFVNLVIDHFAYDEHYFMYNSYLNYHDDNNENSPEGSNQSYIGRLIFVHIGYIEWYRRYLIKKRLMSVDINEKITTLIKQYLEIYDKLPKYLRSPAHDGVFDTMSRDVEAIKNSNYSDFIKIIGSR